MDDPIPVAYILLRFPHLTETFIAEEIRQVQSQGTPVRIFSLLPPRPGPVHPTSQGLLAQVEYAPPLHSPVLWLAQLAVLFTRPRRYLRLLRDLMAPPAPRASWRLKRLAVFVKGVALARRLRGSPVRLVHSHFAWLSAAAALTVSRLLDRPFTVTAHASDIYSPENDLLCLIGGAAARVIAISEHNRQAITALCPAAQGRITVIHCGIDLARFPPAPPPPDDPVRILSVGSLTEKKGHEYLIRACRLLRDRGLDFRCTIVGRGERRAALARLIDDLALADRVSLAGALEQPQVRQALHRSHLFALACVVARDGDRDGIPVAMMEALATGRPVVSSRVSGIPELVRHGETGLLVPPRNAEALADALARLIRDRALRQRLGENGRALVAHEFDIRANAARLRSIFNASGLSEPGTSDFGSLVETSEVYTVT